MVKIEIGGEYKATRVRSGENDRGEWELVVVKAEGRARQNLTIFPTNIPTGIHEGDIFKVNKIEGVAVKQKKDSNGNWTLQDTNVWAELEKVSSDAFADLGGLDDLDGLL